MRSKTIGMALALTLSAGAALAQGYTQMRLATQQDWAADQAAQTWLKEFQPKEGVQVYYQTYKVGSKNVTVFVGLTDACDDGPNSKDSAQFWSNCPMNVLWQDGVRSTSRTVDGACFALIGSRDPGRNGTVSRFDVASQTIIVETLRDAKPIPECTVSVKAN